MYKTCWKKLTAWIVFFFLTFWISSNIFVKKGCSEEDTPIKVICESASHRIVRKRRTYWPRPSPRPSKPARLWSMYLLQIGPCSTSHLNLAFCRPPISTLIKRCNPENEEAPNPPRRHCGAASSKFRCRVDGRLTLLTHSGRQLQLRRLCPPPPR